MVFLIVSANGDTEKVLELLEIHREQNAKLDTVTLSTAQQRHTGLLEIPTFHVYQSPKTRQAR